MSAEESEAKWFCKEGTNKRVILWITDTTVIEQIVMQRGQGRGHESGSLLPRFVVNFLVLSENRLLLFLFFIILLFFFFFLFLS